MNDFAISDSKITLLKSKFFVYRIVLYFTFLLIPVWIPKLLEVNALIQTFLLSLYIVFISGQWYMLGKEVDHRFKIYYKVNSSMDRIIYRSVMGMSLFILYFGLLSLLPGHILKHFFWGTWVVLGLFYSWPTRGKIIQESMSSQFGEFRFLDSFEKTVLGMSVLLFFTSFPEVPKLENIEALKLYFDPNEVFHDQIWNFLSVNYFPFRKFPNVYKIAWCLHFYMVAFGLFSFTFYAVLRIFLSRRLAVLGVFALLSSWSISKIFSVDYTAAFKTGYCIVWVWSLMWITKSSTYRSGLFAGIVHFYGAVISPVYFFLYPIYFGTLYFLLLKEKTVWFKKQVLKYSVFGFLLACFTFVTNTEALSNLQSLSLGELSAEFIRLLDRKAFFSLSIFGLLLLVVNEWIFKKKNLELVNLNRDKQKELYLAVLTLTVGGLIWDRSLVSNFSLMWIVAFLSLIPLEWIFQSISRFRSRRNMIYVIYILICLLDSHFEGRIKIIAKLLE